MKVINLTPHNVDICDINGKVIKTYEPSGIVVRNAWYPKFIGNVDGVALAVQEELEKAKQVWDETLDVSEVAEALGIWREEADDLIRLIITDEQVKQIQDEEWD